jgi:hypothetical protein
MGRTCPGSWDGDTFTADDGRVFVLFSEHVRGEPRFWWANRRDDGRELLDGEGTVMTSSAWISLPFDGSTARAQVKGRVQRYVRETSHAAG